MQSLASQLVRVFFSIDHPVKGFAAVQYIDNGNSFCKVIMRNIYNHIMFVGIEAKNGYLP